MIPRLLILAATLAPAGAAIVLPDRAGAASARETVAAVTVRAGTNLAASSAPDGATVMDLQGQLWLLPAGRDRATPLTDGRGDDRLPRLHPDGRTVVFQTFRRGNFDVWAMDRDGGNARPLTSGPDDDREPEVSADGSSVVFTSDRNGSLDIFRLDLASGAITALVSGPGDDSGPGLAGDGTLAFVSDRGGRMALWLKEPDGEPNLLNVPAGRPQAPVWSPDGRRLAVVVATEQLGFPAVARQRLYVVSRDGSGLAPVSDPDEDVFPLRAQWLSAERIQYTADGQIRSRLVGAPPGAQASERPFTARIPVAPRPTVRRRDMARGGPVLGILDPAVDPRTGAVAFVALGDLWLREQGGSLQSLTRDAAVERDPAFSADGTQLAFVSDRRGQGRLEAWVRDLATGADRRVGDLPRGLRHPVFDRPGERLYVQQAGPRGNQDFTLHEISLATGATRPVKAPGIWPATMGISGDGRHLLVVWLAPRSQRYREGRNTVLRIELATGVSEAAGLPDSVDPDSGVALAPDGRFAALTVGGVLHTVQLKPDGRVVAGSLAPAGPGLPAGLADFPAPGPDQSVTYVGNRGLTRIPRGARADRPRPLAVDLRWREAPVPGPLRLRVARIFDGESPGYRTGTDVVIRGGRIAALVPRSRRLAGIPLRDLGDRTLLPGLFDHHVHWQGHDGGYPGTVLLAFGVTSVVEPGGQPHESRELLESWASGRRPGPRLFFSGPQLDGDRRFFPFAIAAPDRARLEAELARARRLDYRLLKTYTRLPGDLQALVIRAGGRLGIPVSSHEIHPALATGGGRVEHLRGTSRLGYSTKQSDLLAGYDDVTGIVGRSGAVICPTVVVGGGFIDYVLSTPGVLELPQLALLPVTERRNLAALPLLVGNRRPLLAAAVGNARRMLYDLHAAGATVVAGTDSPIFTYGLSLHGELANYAAAGLPPAVVLRSATAAAADAIGAGHELGRVATGWRADLLVVDGDPLARIGDLARVALVLKDGAPVAGSLAGTP